METLKGKIIKKHWLHGELRFLVDVQQEDSCLKCVHWHVCKKDMQNFCENYCFGTSENTNCGGCLHRHTRPRFGHQKDGIPCFKCGHFKEQGLNPSKR